MSQEWRGMAYSIMGSFDKEVVARAIREGRVAKGLTQQELADLAGISLRSVQRIEGGEVVPRAYTLRVLGEKLGAFRRRSLRGLCIGWDWW